MMVNVMYLFVTDEVTAEDVLEKRDGGNQLSAAVQVLG